MEKYRFGNTVRRLFMDFPHVPAESKTGEDILSRLYQGKVTPEMMDLVFRHILLVNELNDSSNRGESLETLVKTASDRLKEIHHFRGVVVMMRETDDAGQPHLVVFYHNLESRPVKLAEKLIGLKVNQLRAPFFQDSIYRQLYEKGKPLISSGPELLRYFQDLLEPGNPLRNLAGQAIAILGVSHMFALPMTDSGGTFGHISCFSDDSLPESVREPVILVCDKIGEIITRNRSELRRHETERRYTRLFDEMLSAFALHEIIIDKKGLPVDYRFLEVNRAFEEMTGLEKTHITGKKASEVLPTLDPFWIETYGRVALTQHPERFQRFSEELSRFYDVSAFSPEPGCFATVFHDITYQKNLEREMKVSEERLKLALYAARQGLFDIDIRSGEFVVSSEYAAILGYSPVDFTENMESWMERIHPDDREKVKTRFQRYLEGEVLEFNDEYRMLTASGKYQWILSTGATVEWDEQATPHRVIGTMVDISARKAMEQQLVEAKRELELAYLEAERLSRTDGLTNLSNRRSFNDLFEVEWKRAIRGRYDLAVLMMDIDYFKQFNDTQGHVAGDGCLVRVAECIRRSVRRPPDIVARYGGEEFVVLLPDTNEEGALIVAENIRKAIADLGIPHPASSVQPTVTISVGASSLVPDREASKEILLRSADRALYRAKDAGRNRSLYEKYSDKE
jgi:diguanylate cyclase (GGDEF)-like protein/PAS domain S-box-containing protein